MIKNKFCKICKIYKFIKLNIKKIIKQYLSKFNYSNNEKIAIKTNVLY